MIIAAIQDRHMDRLALQALRRVESGKSAADDHHMWNILLLHGTLGHTLLHETGLRGDRERL